MALPWLQPLAALTIIEIQHVTEEPQPASKSKSTGESELGNVSLQPASVGIITASSKSIPRGGNNKE